MEPSAATLALARPFAETLLEHGVGVTPARIEWAVKDAADFVAHAGWKSAFAFWFALRFIQWTPLFTLGRFSRFTSLSTADRARHLERLEASSNTSSLIAMAKIILMIVWFEQPEVLAEAGFDVSPHVKGWDGIPGWKKWEARS